MSNLTDHGELRARKRLGIPAKTAAKLAAAAWTDGYHAAQFNGYFRKYLDHHTQEHKSVVRVHKGNVFFFSTAGALITCWPLPAKYRKQFKDRTSNAAGR